MYTFNIGRKNVHELDQDLAMLSITLFGVLDLLILRKLGLSETD